MRKKKKSLLGVLAVANLLAFGALLATPPSIALAGGVDGCEEEGEHSGCDCLDAGTWNPAGCYDNAGEEHICIDYSECE